MTSVCFAAMEEFAGCITSCRNASSILGGTWAVIPRRGEVPPDVLQSGLLVLSSWDERYESILAARRGPVVPRFHAMIMETELVQEAGTAARIVSLLDQGRIPAVAVSDPEYISLLGRAGVVFLPDLFDGRLYLDVVPTPLMGVNVSLFGSAHPRKNTLAQAAAFAFARREVGVCRWTLHLNGQTLCNQAYGLWLATARIPFVDHGRLDRDRYLSLVAGMDAGLCAALCESYCYVAADHVALGVPIVASPGIPCLGDGEGRPAPHDVGGLAAALEEAISNRQTVTAHQRESLEAQAQKNVTAARAALREILSRAGISPA